MLARVYERNITSSSDVIIQARKLACKGFRAKYFIIVRRYNETKRRIFCYEIEKKPDDLFFNRFERFRFRNGRLSNGLVPSDERHDCA